MASERTWTPGDSGVLPPLDEGDYAPDAVSVPVDADVDVAGLLRLAQQATPGPWTVADWHTTTVITERWADEATPPVERGPFMCLTATNGRDADFVAAVSPEVLVGLLTRLRQAEALAHALVNLQCEASLVADSLSTYSLGNMDIRRYRRWEEADAAARAALAVWREERNP